MNCIRCQGPLAHYESQICIKCISDENGGADIDILKMVLKARESSMDMYRSGYNPDVLLKNSKILEGYYGRST